MTDATNKTRESRIEVSKQAHNFSIGHFTILSAKERENLHGHNYQLFCEIKAPLADDGLTFDYGILKRTLRELCDEIDEQMILPECSPYLSIEKENGFIVALFNDERIPFLERDVTLLPISNVTVEELSHYFLSKFVNHPEISGRGITAVTIKIGSSPGQYGLADWSAT